jgi:hypothetical protein
MAFRCPTAKTVGTAVVKDFRLLFRGNDGSAVATIEPEEGSEVPVAVWRLKEKDEIALDRYEGYPSFYRKGMLNIEINGRQTAAMVYFMNEGYPIGTPSENYFHTIQVGYENNGLDINVLLSALDFSDRMSQLDKHMRAHWQQLEMDSNDYVDYEPEKGITFGSM